MPIFNVQKTKLIPIREIHITLERDIQKITEDNLQTVFGLEFVRSEFSLHNLRIDTLAFDKQAKSFVIIEYKRDKNISVIDQGYSYLALLLNNKADFILEYNEKMNHNLKKVDIDWSQSKILFLANQFTTYQRSAINFKDLPIELWEVKKFDNGTMLYNQLKPLEAAESITTVSKSDTIKDVSKEVKKYTLDDHFKPGWGKSRELFDVLREKISGIGNFDEVATKAYIGYQINRWNIFVIIPQKKKLKIELNRSQPKDIKDPDKIVLYYEYSIKNWGQHISYFYLENPEQIDYAIYLIKQVYEKFLNTK